jgi:hypothetical protein
MDGSEARIAGARTIVAVLLQVIEKSAEHGGVEVLQGQDRRRFLGLLLDEA